MRREFGIALYEQMKINENIIVVTGDLGFGLFDRIRQDFPTRFFNVGAAEQTMMGIAVGLAMSGKIPFVYSITPFLIARPYETIRLYVNHESVPVKLIGSGRDKDYAHDGVSHDASDDVDMLAPFTKIIKLWPNTKEEIPALLHRMIEDPLPYYVNLKR